MGAPTLAFGVEPCSVPYRLKLARYAELASDVSDFLEENGGPRGSCLDLLDVGVGNGVSRRYIEKHPGAERIRYHGVDRFPHGRQFVYKHEDWQLHQCCLEQGLPFLKSDRYDIVLCEQVLEHLKHPEVTAIDLLRVLKPGGLLIVGVPIFPPGLHLFRRHVVPVLDRWFKLKKYRGHCQAFTLNSFVRLLDQGSDPENGFFELDAARGFRIISGGPLRPLENFRWWWQFNRWLGATMPSLCIEAQIRASKTPPAVLPLRHAFTTERSIQRKAA